MEWLKNRRTAWIIMIAAVVLSVLLGSVRSVSSLRQQTEQTFTQGTRGDGLGISHYLESRASLSGNLITVAGRYLDSSDARIVALRQAADALSSAQTPSAKYQADQNLNSAFQSVYDALEGQYLSQKDADYRTRLQYDFKSRAASISYDGYNGLVQNFNDKVLRATPGGAVASAVGVKPLELYTMTGGNK
ncbi:LemA family protein [Faecalispora anaeroviscerum]|uniref:LemA family protein n=1 Tax=Faecalispora anaeroviscerum TaxID=2991836 RepID=UPI0024BAF162|nr:LemA family protein [Faecalispora anaeroviscerum]